MDRVISSAIRTVERRYFTYTLFAALSAGLFGWLYSEGHVYTRFRSAQCSTGVLNKMIEDSSLCCHGHRSYDWVCVAAYDQITAVMSSGWAWILPLLPWLAAAGREKYSETKDSTRPATLRRGAFYLALFLYRTVIIIRILLGIYKIKYHNYFCS